MRKLIFPLLLCISITASTQFKNDNVLYKTIDFNELCATLDKYPEHLLLDVRSPGEYYDTSRSASLNLGHLKGAKNINIGELGKRLGDIKQYKDEPVFIYCSHSQRSRRASKMLADSGFTNVYNINGGLTSLYYGDRENKPCLKAMVETKNNYSIISFSELRDALAQKDPPMIVDVRSDSAFRHISLNAKDNAMGYIKGSVNIPLEKFNGEVEIPKDKQVVLIDLYGDESSKAAAMLTAKGYRNISVLIEGIDRLLYTNTNEELSRNKVYVATAPYVTMNVSEFGKWASANSNYVVLDVRTVDEYTNKSKDSWRNVGHLKNAVNIPLSDLNSRVSELDKNKEIVIYSLGGGNEAFDAAASLQKQGFNKIKVIYGGIFNLRWTAGNVKGESYLKDWVVDVPESNQ